MKFSFKLTGSGWGEATLSDDGSSATITGGYCTDASGDLLRTILRLLEGVSDVRFSWDNEPQEYRWIFVQRDSRVTLQILRFQDIYEHCPDAQGEPVFETSDELSEVARAIVEGYDGLVEDIGIDGYNEEWHLNPFPSSELETIRGLLQVT